MTGHAGGPSFEYRIWWHASSNINFKGSSGWLPWDGWEETEKEVRDALESVGGTNTTQVLAEALDLSGFECGCEVREAVDA